MMSNVIFTKYSNDRDPKFNIVTEIVKDDSGERWVFKRPFTEDAAEHINRIVINSEALRRQYQGSAIEIADTVKMEGSVRIPWVSGEAFSAYLDRLLEAGKEEEWQEVMEEYFRNLFVRRKKARELGPEFRTVFGEYQPEGEIEAAENMDIDALFSNVIYHNGKWVLYDCEWVMPFAVPVRFLIYRCLFFYINRQNRFSQLNESLYDRFGITEAERQEFEKMEDCFQTYTAGSCKPMWRLYRKLHGAVVDVKTLHEAHIRRDHTQIYYDYGSGYSEENSMRFLADRDGEDHYNLSLDIPEKAVGIRIDPVSRACIVGVIKIADGHGKALPYKTNGNQVEQGVYSFVHADPQIIINKVNPGDTIQMEYVMQILEGISEDALKQAGQSMPGPEQRKIKSCAMKIKRKLANKRKQL